jgi:hypothetical protein
MKTTLLSIGDCPVCADYGTVLVAKPVASSEIFFFCPACGVAWLTLPEALRLDSIDPVSKFAPTGIVFPTMQEVEDAGLAGFVKKECHFEDWQSLIETYPKKS